MRIKCGYCGKSVSTEVPDGTVVRAWVECPECIENLYPTESDNHKKATIECCIQRAEIASESTKNE